MATSCTIDYLATAQPHKRSMSLRHHSLLSFGGRNTGDSRVDLGTNRLASFLRRLFNRREPRQLTRRHEAATQSQNWPPSSQKDERLRWSNNRSLSQEPPSRLPCHSNSAACQTERQPFSPSKSISASPSLSSQLSGSNSLIEILDCSPDLARTKRTLRRERTDGRLRPNRAQSWRLILRRPESELSQQSKSSGQGSAELRGSSRSHNYTETTAIPEVQPSSEMNEREKDFIDSIKILRQASRHAILSSRSPSKGSSDSERTDRLSSTAEPTKLASPESGRLPVSPDTTVPITDKRSSSVPPPMNGHDLIGQPQKFNDCCLCSTYASSKPHQLDANCPLAYCPPPLACYCFQQLGELANPISCPLWCSMLCSLPYPLPIYGSPSPLAMAPPLAAPMSHLPPPPPPPSLSQKQKIGDLLENTNYSSSSVKQQQQHNTTIDLKIEIGADFKAQLARAASLENRRNRSTVISHQSDIKDHKLDDSCDEQSDSMTRSDGRNSDNQQLSSLTSNQSEDYDEAIQLRDCAVKRQEAEQMFGGFDGGQLSSFSDSLASHDDASAGHYLFQEHDRDSNLSSSNQDSPADSLNNCMSDSQSNHGVGKTLEASVR